MRYATVCSGIEAPSVAWHSLGWEPVFFSEIEPFPCAVLAHHYPKVPNLGDMTKFKDWPDATFDVLCGGTPCQSFSVAGLRKGLADPRGNLTLTYLAVAHKYRPRWLVWENVPGVLSDGTGAFGAFLGGLAELGYGFAYRILDAQYCGVPQRRRRVFVVGHLGDWRAAAAVLFERHSLQGNPAPSREAGERVAPTAEGRAGRSGANNFATSGGLVELARPLRAQAQASHRLDSDTYVAHSLRADGFDASEDGTGRGTPLVPAVCPALKSRDHKGPSSDGDGDGDGAILVPIVIQGAGRTSQGSQGSQGSGLNHDVSFTLNNVDVHAVAYDERNITSVVNRSNPQPVDPCHTLHNPRDAILTLAIRGRGDSHNLEYRDDGIANAILTPNGGRAGIGVGAVAFQPKASRTQSMNPSEISPTLGTTKEVGALHHMQVRRLTPRECERLQGFEDDYTLIPYRGKHAKDGPRYKALGNSMAVPVMRWIGQRIASLESEPVWVQPVAIAITV